MYRVGNRASRCVRRVVQSFVRQPLSSFVFALPGGSQRSASVEKTLRFHAWRARAPCCTASGLCSRAPHHPVWRRYRAAGTRHAGAGQLRRGPRAQSLFLRTSAQACVIAQTHARAITCALALPFARCVCKSGVEWGWGGVDGSGLLPQCLHSAHTVPTQRPH